MVRRARIRLTLLFVAMFAVVLGFFSVVFYVAFAIVLQPDFDLDPDLTNAQVAEATYAATIGRIGISVAIADAAAVLIVAIAAWVLARRTLEPIRDAHLRQQRFVADASHETRNPLAAIKATTEAALGPNRSPEELRAALETVDATADRLIRLTGDLLVLARSNDPLAPSTREPSDLSVVVAEALAELTPIGRSGAIVPALQPDVPVLIDPEEIRRIARNLVENALRYGGDEVSVVVRTWTSDGDACLEVRDDGPGIKPADLTRIFDPFYRSATRDRDAHGIGLGLAIAQDLAARNGGRLTVASVPGSGATFRLILPRLRERRHD
jgi:signal transduction histidine kinase